MLDRTGIDFQLWIFYSLWIFSSVQFSCLVVSDSLRPHELQYARPLCPSPIPAVYSNSCPSSQWCHPAISSSVVPFSSCPQSLPASGPFPMSQLLQYFNSAAFAVKFLETLLLVSMTHQFWMFLLNFDYLSSASSSFPIILNWWNFSKFLHRPSSWEENSLIV